MGTDTLAETHRRSKLSSLSLHLLFELTKKRTHTCHGHIFPPGLEEDLSKKLEKHSQ